MRISAIFHKNYSEWLSTALLYIFLILYMSHHTLYLSVYVSKYINSLKHIKYDFNPHFTDPSFKKIGTNVKSGSLKNSPCPRIVPLPLFPDLFRAPRYTTHLPSLLRKKINLMF